MTTPAEPTYQRIFDPSKPPRAVAGSAPGELVADRATPGSYVFDEALVLAVNVALATGRPLLLRGRPGTGKSSVAASVAHRLRRRFYEKTITSRTQARDLLWTVDDVARLSDATAAPKRALDRERYLTPGPLWWAFDRASAVRRGLEPGVLEPARDPAAGATRAADSVVLLDEIDKADPDVPNDLLEPLGWYQFRTERGVKITATSLPLVVITTNEERELPRAFLRRCVAHTLPMPTVSRLVAIATARFGATMTDLATRIAQVLPVDESAGPSPADDPVVDVSIAEYLDVVRAASRLATAPGAPQWNDILAVTVDSNQQDAW